MYIEKRVKLQNNIYYIRINVQYKKNSEGIDMLCLKDYKGDYFDGGDLSTLIEKIEKSYTEEKSKKYSKIGLLGDAIYLYERIPVIDGIKDVYLNKEGIPYSIGFISKEEIEKYIQENNIPITSNTNFKLNDERTWIE